MTVPVFVKEIANTLVRTTSRFVGSSFKVAIQPLRPGRVLELAGEPRNMGELPPHMHQWFRERTELPAQFIYRFEQVKVAWNGVVVNKLRVFLPSLVASIVEHNFTGAFLLRQWTAETTYLDETIGLIYDSWSLNYYHWLVDVLPRLLLLREAGVNCTLLVPASAPEYAITSIRAFGFESVQFIDDEEFIAPRQLLMPSRVAVPGKQDPELLRQVRAHLLAQFQQARAHSVGKRTRRVYVSRSQQKFRQLVNEVQILPLLATYGIEVVYFEGLSLAQQIQLMQDVAVIIGVHGANLANMLFLSGEATVVELLNSQVPNPCYFYLASSLSLAYYAVPCEGVSSGYDTIFNSQNLHVNVELLEDILRALDREDNQMVEVAN